LKLAKEEGFKVLVAHQGAMRSPLARAHQPTAISLDIFLPDMLGWTVLSQLKQQPLGRLHALHHHAARHGMQSSVFIR